MLIFSYALIVLICAVLAIFYAIELSEEDDKKIKLTVQLGPIVLGIVVGLIVARWLFGPGI